MEDTNKLTWTISEAAKAVGISDDKMRAIIRESSDCPAFKFGEAKILVPIAPFIEWLNNLGKSRYGFPVRPASQTFDLIMRKRKGKEA